MTDGARKRLIDLSVVAVSAVVVAAGALIVADVDGHAPRLPVVLSVATQPTAPSTSPTTAEALTPPVPGLEPAPRPTKRIIYLRPTRPS